MKNYTQHEQHTYNFSLSLRNMETLRKIGSFQPEEVSLMDDVVDYLHGIHVDDDADGVPIIYEVAATHISELRGLDFDLQFSKYDFHFLLLQALVEVPESTSILLYWFFVEWQQFMTLHPRSEYKYYFPGFMKHVEEDKTLLSKLNKHIASLRGEPLNKAKEDRDIIAEICGDPNFYFT